MANIEDLLIKIKDNSLITVIITAKKPSTRGEVSLSLAPWGGNAHKTEYHIPSTNTFIPHDLLIDEGMEYVGYSLIITTIVGSAVEGEDVEVVFQFIQGNEVIGFYELTGQTEIVHKLFVFFEY